jgi:hypothetical protein
MTNKDTSFCLQLNGVRYLYIAAHTGLKYVYADSTEPFQKIVRDYPVRVFDRPLCPMEMGVEVLGSGKRASAERVPKKQDFRHEPG